MCLVGTVGTAVIYAATTLACLCMSLAAVGTVGTAVIYAATTLACFCMSLAAVCTTGTAGLWLTAVIAGMRTTGVTRGVMVSTSAFQACHQCQG